MTDFDIIREALFLVTPETQIGALNALNSLRAVLAERDAEIERLRGVAMDLSKVPEGSEWSVGNRPLNNDFWAGCESADHTGGHLVTGPTPAAALNAAIERTK